MYLRELDWDRKLNIHTTGRDDSDSDEQNFPYEPTPYVVLERLSESGYIRKEHHVLDCGCGKGRVCFFLTDACGCRTTGIDMSEKMVQIAENNRSRFPKKKQVDFQKCSAEYFKFTDEDILFFFNPFTETILHGVIGHIRKSWCANPRQIRLFCYYPSDEFVSCLMTEPDFIFEDEIDCRDLFDGNNARERILIFKMDTV
ncbi:MAG: class I SAM-dependent methyltransferase [Parasporobacterium sp.]|nr:class I SAM-dependent methyltransferase [Parasporobacterium sp.]